MTVSDSDLKEIRDICPGATLYSEGGFMYIHLPGLKIPVNDKEPLIRDGLLCLQTHSGYPTRLFLSEQIPGKGKNWSVHRILDKTWHTWSWNYVPPDDRPAAVLAQHLRALR